MATATSMGRGDNTSLAFVGSNGSLSEDVLDVGVGSGVSVSRQIIHMSGSVAQLSALALALASASGERVGDVDI